MLNAAMNPENCTVTCKSSCMGFPAFIFHTLFGCTVNRASVFALPGYTGNFITYICNTGMVVSR